MKTKGGYIFSSYFTKPFVQYNVKSLQNIIGCLLESPSSISIVPAYGETYQ